MPRYLFHVEDGAYVPDTEGTELPGINEARSEAVIMAGAMLKGGHSFWGGPEEWRMSVTDENNIVLFTLRFCVEEPSEQVEYQPPS